MFLTLLAMTVFIASIVLVPWIIIEIPSDYFTHPKRQKYLREGQPPFIQWVFMFLKNVAGVVFIIAGVAMLFLPGQGILTIIVGLFFVDFPYKYKVQKWIIRQPGVLKAVNWLRKKAKRYPLEV